MKQITTFKKSLGLATMVAVASGLGACNPDDEKLFKDQGNNEAKPAATLLGNLQGGLDAQASAAPEAANITYLVRVKGESGVQLCEGSASLVLMSDFNIRVPQAKISCQSIVIDLGGLLGGDKGLNGGGDSAAVAGGKEDALKNLSHDGKTFYLKEILGGTFEPPRPILLGPIIQNPKDYAGLEKTTSHTVTGVDPVSKQNVTGTGKFTVKVKEAQGFYKNKYVTAGFENVMNWELSATGFEDFPPNVGLTVEKMEWWWNTRPIMVPQLVITGYLKNFISDPDGTTDALVGRIELSLIVKEYKIED